MQSAETVLKVLHDRGQRRLPVQRLFRQLTNPDLYRRAYARLYRNDGALTPGTTPETVDGMALAKIEAIIAAVRQERYRWRPVRRVLIEKRHSPKKRPLGLPSWSDKLLQEVVRSLLNAYYEPQFSQFSHGFRPGRGCHTALTAMHETWKGTVWFIEGDIAACFTSLDHEILLATLAEKIHDSRFLRLVAQLLKAGYLEDWRYHPTLSGVPQGAVASPVLSNVYLNRLDQFVETVLLPQYNRGARRKANPAYSHLQNQAYRLEHAGQYRAARPLRQRQWALPSSDTHDPDFRRLHYVRYADDFLLGLAGPRGEAEAIKAQLTTFLRDTLKLELSEAKTMITHARTQAAHFLGHELRVLHRDQRRTARKGTAKHVTRSINGMVELRVPATVLKEHCARYLAHGKPIHRNGLIDDSDFTIVATYQAEYRGLVEYYQLAHNLHSLNRLRWVMETSLLCTLARKHRASVVQQRQRYRTRLQTAHGPRQGLQVVVERGEGKKPLVATWGGISLQRRKRAILSDHPTEVWSNRSELLQRLLAETCELCGSHDRIEVHHIRHLRDLRRHGRRPPPRWVQVMAARRRKTLVVCRPCHDDIHAGRPLHQRPAD
jgi:group II intron reverse transcriptase/maturase